MQSKTEKEKMLSGQLYNALDPELSEGRKQSTILFQKFNDLRRANDNYEDQKTQILTQLLGKIGKNVDIVPPFYCDYGKQIEIGDNSQINYGCVILDVNKVVIGKDVLFGPNVQIYTAGHPTDAKPRRSGAEFGLPIIIKDGVWVGGNSVICPQVTIGENSIVAAGAVVTKDVPDNCLVGGIPARIIKALEASKL